MLTEDGRCGWCGAAVEGTSTEPWGEYDGGHGYLVPLAVATTLRPCGHVWVDVVRDTPADQGILDKDLPRIHDCQRDH
jgi:hypothetical protein